MPGVRRECNSRAAGRVNGDDLESSRKARQGGAESEAGVGVNKEEGSTGGFSKGDRVNRLEETLKEEAQQTGLFG